MSSSSSLYVLACEGGRYYVGVSANVDQRIASHFGGEGCAWTQKYPVIRTILVRPIQNSHDENNTTKDYMTKYGIDNVRGGAYAQVELSVGERRVLEKELCSVSASCYKCGGPGHLAAECKVLSQLSIPATQYTRHKVRQAQERTRQRLRTYEVSSQDSSSSTSAEDSYDCFTCGREFSTTRALYAHRDRCH